MKKLMMIAVLVGMTVAAQAQDKEHKTAAERAAQRTQHMTKELGLTSEQATKVESINLKYAEQAEAKRAEREADRTVARQEGKETRDAFDAELKTVLTAEQYAKWTAKLEERKERQDERSKQMPQRRGQ